MKTKTDKPMNATASGRLVFPLGHIPPLPRPTVLAVPLACFTALCLSSCVPPKPPKPLSLLGPSKIGPISCQLDPGGATKPVYASSATNLLNGSGNSTGDMAGAIAELILKGAKTIAVAPAQKELENISFSLGNMERKTVHEEFRKQLVAAGYKVTNNATTKATVVVSFYGIHKEFNGHTRMLISGGLFLKDASGKTIWDGNVYTTTEAPKSQFQEYVANPSLYGREFTDSAKVLAKAAVGGVGHFSPEYDPETGNGAANLKEKKPTKQ